jgi:hypothetical protein
LKEDPADLWKHQWFYAGFSFGYSAQILRVPVELDYHYYFEDAPIAFSLYALFQPFDIFGITLDISGDILEGPIISVAPTLTIRPSAFEVNLFLGIGSTIRNGDGALFGGIRGGYKVGPGILFAEVRPIGYALAYVPEDSNVTSVFISFHLNVSVGYQIGFIQRKK